MGFSFRKKIKKGNWLLRSEPSRRIKELPEEEGELPLCLRLLQRRNSDLRNWGRARWKTFWDSKGRARSRWRRGKMLGRKGVWANWENMDRKPGDAWRMEREFCSFFCDCVWILFYNCVRTLFWGLRLGFFHVEDGIDQQTEDEQN